MQANPMVPAVAPPTRGISLLPFVNPYMEVDIYFFSNEFGNRFIKPSFSSAWVSYKLAVDPCIQLKNTIYLLISSGNKVYVSSLPYTGTAGYTF